MEPFHVEKVKKIYAATGGGWNTLRATPQECQWAAKKGCAVMERSKAGTGEQPARIAGMAAIPKGSKDGTERWNTL